MVKLVIFEGKFGSNYKLKMPIPIVSSILLLTKNLLLKSTCTNPHIKRMVTVELHIVEKNENNFEIIWYVND